jgi:hypothetical protein
VMWVLHEEGVPFQMIARSGGIIECWRQPELAPWEAPRRHPDEPRPRAPEVAEEHRAMMRAWRGRRRARKAAKLAAASDDGAGDDIAA